MQRLSLYGRVRRDRITATSAKTAHKRTLCLCTGLSLTVIVAIQPAVILPGSSLHGKDSLSGCRNHLIWLKVPADPVLQAKPFQSGCR